MMLARLVITFPLVAACAHARSADEYRTDTAVVLSAHASDLKACYDQVLTTNPHAAGRVTVRFAVEEKTGRVRDVQLDTTRTTAPQEVSQCVVAALPAATLSPPDRKRGEATWSWDFAPQPGSAPVPAPK